MRQLRKQKIQKVIAAVSSLALALTATVPFMSGAPSVKAAAVTASPAGGYLYDMTDGSVVPKDAPGNVPLTVDRLTFNSGTKHAYAWHDAQHGTLFKDGNTIDVKVDGPTKLTIGDCQYNNATSVTVKSANGSYTETLAAKTGCYDQTGAAMVFKYDGPATTLTVEFNNGTYVPVIIVDPLNDIPDNNGVPKDSVYMFTLGDGSIIPNETKDQVVETKVSSKDGVLTVNSNGNVRFNSNQHGVTVSNGASFDIKVAGDSLITFDLCTEKREDTDKDSTITASSPKGEFVGETTLPLYKDLNGIDGASSTFEYKGVATTLTFTVKTSNTINIHNILVANKPAETSTPKTPGNGKIDVWDFSTEKLDESKYNNLLTPDILNAAYPAGTAAGSTGVNIRSFISGDLLFNCGGATNNRLRTRNEAISRWDGRNTEIDGIAFTGQIYSNAPSTAGVYLGVKMYPGDILTIYASSNGNASTIYCESPSGEIQTGETDNSPGRKLTFYAPEYGIYKLYSVNEKLVVWRALREHTNPVQVSGKIDTTAASDITSKGYTLLFTNRSTGAVTEAVPSNGSYSVYLNDSYTYDISLGNANGYILKNNSALTIASGASAATRDITIERVDTATITGKITGLSADALSKLKLSFANKDHAYIPELSVSGDSFTLYVEKGVVYNVTAEGVNDYSPASATISASANTTQNIAFNAKPTYNVNVKYSGLPDSAAKTAVLTFTNIDEDGYVYTFKAGETPKLRDGRYTVKVTGTGSAPYAQKLTSNANVNGKAVDKTIPFEKLEVWDFSKYNAGNPGLETIDGNNCYLGLALTGNVQENKTYLLVGKDGEVKIPVKKGQLVSIEYCYQGAFEVNGKQILSASGSTSKMETYSFTASSDGTVTIKGIEGTTADGKSAKQTYFTKISAAEPVPYKSQITVGANKQYKTVNDALAAVEKMSRPGNERVEIVIDPGNYEEMLRVNVPNVSLVNAAGKDSSLSIINKGVDIDKNVVRITSYYGHGYDYYSMGANSKWDAEVLAVNKENGYLSNENVGAGTNNNSYWNSTVVVYAEGFSADGIVFENSFNQYISKKESEDIVVMKAVGNKGERPTKYGDTTVQKNSFKERAGAMAILGDKAVFNNCKFVGRQDTLYGAQNIKVKFEKCDILGSVDFIYGGMNAVFNECMLRMNTNSADTADLAYITAAQQSSGRGFLFNNCTVTSTTPGVDTAAEYRSKPGYFGRPWQANTSEVVFFNTTVETTDAPGFEGKSLIVPEGWNTSLGGQSVKMYEYGTKELSGENNTANRASWSTELEKPELSDGTKISIDAFLGDWDGTNPKTGTAGIATAIAFAALAGAAILVAKKKK